MELSIDAARNEDSEPSSRDIHLGVARQLVDRAIRMFFEGENALFVLAIANPGHVLLHDIAREMLESGNAVAQIARQFVEAGVITESDKPVQAVLKALRRDANSLKHIAVDPGVNDDSVFATLVVAVNDAMALNIASGAMLLFAGWAISKVGEGDDQTWKWAERLFPELLHMPAPDQKRLGLDALNNPTLMERLEEIARTIDQEEGGAPSA